MIDYLLIAEAVTGIPAETLAKLPRIDLADSALHAPRAEFGGVDAVASSEMSEEDLAAWLAPKIVSP